jgi:hypothetical protein
VRALLLCGLAPLALAPVPSAPGAPGAPGAHVSQAAGEPLLAPGPHAVGFRATWLLDESRTYRAAWDGGATYSAEPSPRPVLALAWFPARVPDGAAFLPHSAYFEIASDDPRLAALASALAAHARAIFVEQVLGASEAELDDARRARLAALLARLHLFEPTVGHIDVLAVLTEAREEIVLRRGAYKAKQGVGGKVC